MHLPQLAKKPAERCLLFGFLIVFTLSVNADMTKLEPSLTLGEAIQLATENQPLLQSLEDAATSSRLAAIAEGQLPDPKIKFGLINLPVTGSDAFRYSRDDQTMMNIGLSQEVISLKKREIASNRMLAEADQFQTEQVATARVIARDAALAWLDVFDAQRKSELYQRMTNDMLAERKIATASISSGSTKTRDVLRLDTEISLTKEKAIFAQRDERKARAMLARWIGASAIRPISLELPLESAFESAAAMTGVQSQSAQTQIKQHPLLKNAQQTELVALLDADKAQAELQKNWSWEISYGKRFAERSDMLSFQVSVDLQLDKINRQDKRIAQKLVLVEKARKLTQDKERELLTELESVMADASAAQAREKEHLVNLIPNAQARLALAQAAYATGKEPLSQVWEARRGVIEVELDHWNILTDRQRAAVKLAYLVHNSP